MIRLWRYIDLPTLLSILEYSAIYFQPPSTYEDPFEAVFHINSLDRFCETMKTIANFDVDSVPMKLIAESDNATEWTKTRDFTKAMLMSISKSALVSCWHQNDVESEAMWKLYAKEEGSVAIVTTVQKLASILPKDVGDVIPVQYIDYETVNESLSPANAIFFKRKSFAHEREYRAFFFDFDQMKIPLKPNDLPITTMGKFLPIHPNEFIEELLISPYTKPWVVDLIPRILIKYAAAFPIKRSSLMMAPNSSFLGR